MFKTAALLLLVLSFQCINAQITLTNNIGTTLIKTDMYSCLEEETWGKVFNLSDFGIAPNEQFVIKSGQIGITQSDIGSQLYFSVYIVDERFPDIYNSYFDKPLLGTSGAIATKAINGNPEIMELDFYQPIIVPAGIKKILVIVGKQMDYTNYTSAKVFIAGTQGDRGESWYKGCNENQRLVTTTDLTIPVPNANFYITVKGEVSNSKSQGSITRITHNVCDDLVKTDMYACYGQTFYWARDFNLKDFGISPTEEFTINSGQVAVNGTAWGATAKFNIYKIDANFPASFSETDLIGSSQVINLPPAIGNDSQIMQIDFITPVKVSAGIERILVEVEKGNNSTLGGGSTAAFIGGSTQDNGISWFKGCNRSPNIGYNQYFSTIDDGIANANFYINVTGNVKNISNHFEMNFSNICSEFLKEFSIDDASKVASIVWNFGDPASGVNNTSTDLSPFHDFSIDGKYTVLAIVTGKDGTVETLSETIDAKEPPKAYGINNIYACEDGLTPGFSKSFDTSIVTQQVLGGQTDKVVTFIDGKGNKYTSLPNPFTNSIKDKETITVRVSHKDNLCCYSETTFDLIVNPLPKSSAVSDLVVCDNDTDGFGQFNLNLVENLIIGSATDIKVEFYHENGQKILAPLNAIPNLIINEEKIKVKAINTNTNCFDESSFKLIVSVLPKANSLQEIIGCDDNNDGISEYFDTSNVESKVLGNQTGMKVTYFDSDGNQLPNPLPNPFTNTVANLETLTVRVLNPQTNCYSQTFLNLVTSTKPLINQPKTLYACDEGNGFSYFDTSAIESQLIANKTGYRISYKDENGNKLPSPLPINYQNTVAWSQTINVRVENQLNPLCFSETSFKLVVNKLPKINLEKEYFLCDLEPSLKIATDLTFDSWEWTYEDNSVISNSFEVNLIDAGIYTLRVTKINNGISCENSFSFNLVRSTLPKIQEVKIQDVSDNNYIEIITSGDGDFEYSIDGFNFQSNNTFNNISGGVYDVQVRDKKGCGVDKREIVLIDYPKFFTPNNDGYNEYWHILGVEKFPNSVTTIFDRYGKFLKKLMYNDIGWDGTFNGEKLFSSDYWFTVELGNGRNFKGHFSLKR
jgi:gliding motility-associated-like protein